MNVDGGENENATGHPYLRENLARGDFDDVEIESDDEFVDTADGTQEVNSKTYREEMEGLTKLLQDFADGCAYQIQFGDRRFLKTLEKEGAGLFRLARNCLSHERRANSSRVASPTTWESSTASALFYRSRPRHDHGTG